MTLPPRRYTENVETRGRRILEEGRLLIKRVGPSGIAAVVKGTGTFHRTGFENGDWYCDCAARGKCCHLVALMLVTARE